MSCVHLSLALLRDSIVLCDACCIVCRLVNGRINVTTNSFANALVTCQLVPTAKHQMAYVDACNARLDGVSNILARLVR